MMVVNKDKTLKCKYFKTSEYNYSIIGTYWNMGEPDRVVNLNTGVRKNFTRDGLIQLVKDKKAIGYKRL